MVFVEGGIFTMGATSEQGSDAYDDEKSTHSVTLSSYYIGETEVTQALWKAVMGKNPSYFKGDNLPVEQVSYEDVKTFITKLNQKTGKTFRLPTEAEWEYAARGGKKSKGYRYAGSNNIDDVAWYYENSGDKRLNDDTWDTDEIEKSNCRTHTVKTKQPNELGIFDMSGNVSEWCFDWYGDYTSDTCSNPQGPSSGSHRVERGGFCGIIAWGCRVSIRDYDYPSDEYNFLGFRLALPRQF
ncbi:MAG: SUMF1/EgtB/PvdO family nonheme iron enzyme [Bacteroidales bacterium]|nr:SUMF1/EgtB/PvdO family nonheme iron enzyme [Bacteroidales bacterium]